MTDQTPSTPASCSIRTASEIQRIAEREVARRMIRYEALDSFVRMVATIEPYGGKGEARNANYPATALNRLIQLANELTQ